MIKVLHITAHMGGGVGRFLSGMLSNNSNKSDIIHKIVLLEKPVKTKFVEIALSNNIEIVIEKNINILKEEILRSDIVILHWWHHPLMAKFLSEFPDVETRLAVWAHVSGCNYPSIPFEFISLPQRIFFTSEYSYENPTWTTSQRKYIKDNSTVIYGLGVDYKETSTKLGIKNESEFRIGYVGTLSQGKIHPDYAEFCKKTHDLIPQARFVLVGDLTDKNQLVESFEKKGITDFVEFAGYTEDVNSYLDTFDVFGYPLDPFHFGTTENVVIEAMLKELPVVMINQCTEKYIIQDMKDGMLANNSEEYAAKIEYLFKNKKERIRIGKNAKKTVLDRYKIENNILKMNNELIDIYRRDTRKFEFKAIFGDKPYNWFLSCLGAEGDIFEEYIFSKKNLYETKEIREKIKSCKPILRGIGKSSINHFAMLFPEDEILRELQKIIKE